MNDELSAPDAASTESAVPPSMTVPDSAATPDSTVRGMLQDAIQKVMDEIEHHEREARRHLQLAEDLRKELHEGFRVARQEARVKTSLAARSGLANGDSVPVEAEEEAAGRPPRAEGRKKVAGRKARKR